MKKLLSFALSLMLVTASFTGCSSESTTEPDSKPTQSNASGTGSSSKATLQLLQFKEDQAAIIKAMVSDFNAQSDGITIEATILGDDFSATRQARFAGNEGPDIFFVEGYSDAKTWQEYLVDLSNESWTADLAENTVEGVTFDSKTYGFPIGLEGYGFVYNKDLFDQASITKLPETVSELREVCQKLKDKGIQASCDAMAEWWFTGQHLLSLPFADIDDPQGFAAALSAGDKKIADNPYMEGFFDVMDLMVEYGAGPDSIGVDYNTSLSKFAAGETAMMMTGNWAEGSITQANSDISLGVFPVPLSDDPSGARMATNVSAYYAINNKSGYVDEAKTFLNWLHKNYQTYFVDQMNLIPAFTHASDAEKLGMTSKAITEYVNTGKTCPFAFFFWPTGANQDFHAPLQQYATKLLDRDGTLNELQSIWDKYAG